MWIPRRPFFPGNPGAGLFDKITRYAMNPGPGGGSAEALTRSWWYPGVYTSETFAGVGEAEV